MMSSDTSNCNNPTVRFAQQTARALRARGCVDAELEGKYGTNDPCDSDNSNILACENKVKFVSKDTLLFGLAATVLVILSFHNK